MYWKLEELTWEEAEKAFKEADYVILPTGSLEQHGLHLPLNVDSLRATYLVDEVLKSSDRYGLKLIKLPTLPYGCSEHHMKFPGTITIKPETYIQLIKDIGLSVYRHGAKRFLIMNFHGGNLSALSIAMQIIRRETGMKTYLVHWTSYARDLIDAWTTPGWGHACEHETSIILYYRPELVRKHKIVKPKIRSRPPISSFRYFNEITNTGGIGDPTKSSAEFAKQLIEKVTERILKALKETIDVEENRN